MTWYMRWVFRARRRTARPRVIRGTRTAPLPLLPSGPGGVCGRPLHGARDLTNPIVTCTVRPDAPPLFDPFQEHRQRMQLVHVVGRRVARKAEHQEVSAGRLADLLGAHGSP